MVELPKIGFAYLFWLPWVFGFAGLHRFYLRKPVSAVLYLLTWGFFGIGTLYDALNMPRLVARARRTMLLEAALESEDGTLVLRGGRGYERDYELPAGGAGGRTPGRGESIEHVVLRLAQQNHGVVTPAQVALEAYIGAEEAREHIETLVRAGFAEVRATRTGIVVYAFPEFLDDEGRVTLEPM